MCALFVGNNLLGLIDSFAGLALEGLSTNHKGIILRQVEFIVNLPQGAYRLSFSKTNREAAASAPAHEETRMQF
jgi:hypothetical protein